MSKTAHHKGRVVCRDRKRIRMLLACDMTLLMLVNFLILSICPDSIAELNATELSVQIAMGAVCIFVCRFAGGLYKYVWRYGSSRLYLQLIASDLAAGGLYFLMQRFLLPESTSFIGALSIALLNLLVTLVSRLTYRFLYEYGHHNSGSAEIVRKFLLTFADVKIQTAACTQAEENGNRPACRQKINAAVVGAGRIGVMLTDELLSDPDALYKPCCFIDIDREKIGRYISGIPIFSEDEIDESIIEEYQIQEIILALSDVFDERKKKLYEKYQKTGCRIKVYDLPMTQDVHSGKWQMREFDIEDLLFRKALEFVDEPTNAYYSGKTVLISGGGGSIGSELCRQIAKMNPKKLIVLDVYENGAYDIQQELMIACDGQFDLAVEIASICDRAALERIFDMYRPDIVLHAAAHKHVPLMEHNCCEAVKNNVFGTLNMVEVSEKYGVKKFTMISTDKAVNPTNVMGATKRMCELIVQSRRSTDTNFSATRFGNVLGSNGSVIPLFKRQITLGGPVTITDRRVVRYFMTIPEATQLVLQSSAMARNGELYVLDMGKPVKILDLAENMIRLSGLEPYRDIDIIETGLRPGEKLYEELLIKTEELERTQNNMLYVEKEAPKSEAWIQEKLDILREALETGDNEHMRSVLKQVITTYRSPDEVNQAAIKAEKMKKQ